MNDTDIDALADRCKVWATSNNTPFPQREVFAEVEPLLRELKRRRSKELPHCPTCECAPGSWGDIGIEFLFMWMYARNPMLGNMKPIDMMLLGRGDKVAKFIMEARESSMPPCSAPGGTT